MNINNVLQKGQLRSPSSKHAWSKPCRRAVELKRHTTAPAHRSQQDPFALEPIAIDVEYAHLERADGSQFSLAAWVSVVSCAKPLLKTFVRHPALDQDSHGILRSYGGVRLARLAGAPGLEAVREKGKHPLFELTITPLTTCWLPIICSAWSVG